MTVSLQQRIEGLARGFASVIIAAAMTASLGELTCEKVGGGARLMPKRRATKVPVVKAPKPRRVKAAPVASSPAPVLESLRSTLRGGLVGSREDMRARLQLGADEED